MSLTTAGIRSTLFAAAVAAALGSGLAAATAQAAPTDSTARKCDTFTHTERACAAFCSTTPAASYWWDPYTGCCACI